MKILFSVAPTKCDCAKPNGLSDACNRFDFLIGVMVWDIEKLRAPITIKYPALFLPLLPIMEVFYFPPPIYSKEANDYIFPPAWVALKGQDQPNFLDPTWRSQAYNFSYTPTYGMASLITFNSKSETGSYINQQFSSLTNGACNNNVTSPNFNNLVSKPWGPLMEEYYECTRNTSTSFFHAAGIAIGTTSTFVPLFCLLLFYSMTAIYGFNVHRQVTLYNI